jgi:hypothetical protein
MTTEPKRPIEELVRDRTLIEASLAKAYREVAIQHAREGRSQPTWRDGKVVWLTPTDVFALLGVDANGCERTPSPMTAAS